MKQREVSLAPNWGRRTWPASMATLVMLLVAGCAAAPSTRNPTAVTPSNPRRPHDPWVFRAVLDEQPRMVVVALCDGLWLAFDGTTGGLATAMSRPVSFEGAVYTGGHGPQPKTVPSNYEQHERGAAGWTVTDAVGNDHGVRLLGYRLDGTRAVALRWGLDDPPDGVRVEIEDSPTAYPDEESAGGVSWQRHIEVSGLPTGWKATLRFGETAPGRRIDDMIQYLGAPMPDIVTWEGNGQAVFLITYDPLPVEPDEHETTAPEPDA